MMSESAGWRSWRDIEGTVRIEVFVTTDAQRAMSPRQIKALEDGAAVLAGAFLPDEDDDSRKEHR